VKEGVALIKESKSRLKEVENEFEVVKKELSQE
jgi:tetrahydromethanopterin S-methyltransferase subunit G